MLQFSSDESESCKSLINMLQRQKTEILCMKCRFKCGAYTELDATAAILTSWHLDRGTQLKNILTESHRILAVPILQFKLPLKYYSFQHWKINGMILKSRLSTFSTFLNRTWCPKRQQEKPSRNLKFREVQRKEKWQNSELKQRL